MKTRNSGIIIISTFSLSILPLSVIKFCPYWLPLQYSPCLSLELTLISYFHPFFPYCPAGTSWLVPMTLILWSVLACPF
jgi:hypothetical protein